MNRESSMVLFACCMIVCVIVLLLRFRAVNLCWFCVCLIVPKCRSMVCLSICMMVDLVIYFVVCVSVSLWSVNWSLSVFGSVMISVSLFRFRV